MIAGRIQLSEMYEDCGGDHHTIKLALPDDLESLLNGFLKRIYDGDLPPGMVDDEYYNYVSSQLTSAITEGLGGASFGADDFRNTLKAYLDQNIYAFSSARSLYMLEQYRGFLTDADGNLVSESKFISKVADISEIDNVTHLKIERKSAIACAQAAESWETLQVHELLEYRSMENERVCPICSGLNGLVLRTDDPAWSIIMVPNHYGCYCKLVPAGAEMEPSPSDLVGNRIKAANIPPYFKRNVGAQKLVFSNDHPYIQKMGADKLNELDAVKNYGLRTGEKIYAIDTLPGFKELGTKAEANAWWEDMAGSANGHIDLKSADDLTVRFYDEFRHHVLDDNKDDRYRIIKQLKDVLQKPDEIWTSRERGFVQNTYIKYYKDAPIVLAVKAENNVRGITMYEVQKGGKVNYKALQNVRKGILKYKSR